jgi:uncharacterized protein
MKSTTPGSDTNLSDTQGISPPSETRKKRTWIDRLLPGKRGVVCRHCGSSDVRLSHKTPSDSQQLIYRCRTCHHHFKVVSKHPPLPAMISAALFILVVVGVSASFFMSATPDADYRPRVDMQDSAALARLEAAARNGNAQAQYDLGKAYWQHDDYLHAFPLIKTAAAQGQKDAQYLLGTLYFSGHGTVQNYLAAMEQFTKAAEQGHLEAQYQLGMFYRDGLAGPSNRESAYVWLNIAAAQGHADALMRRDKLMMAMSSDEIRRAQEASAQMHQRISNLVAAKQ